MTLEQILLYIGLPLLGAILAKRFPGLLPFLDAIRPPTPAPTPPAPPALPSMSEQLLQQLVADKLGLPVQAPAPGGVPTSVGTMVPVDLHVTTTAVPRAK